MASNMPLWDRIPRPVFDGDPRLVTDRFEAHLDLGRLLRWKACVAPTEDEALAGFPDRDATDLERVAVVELGNEAASGPGLKSELTVSLGGDLKERVWLPPRGDLARKCLEGSRGIGGQA